MQVSSNLFFDRGAQRMGALGAAAARLQTQIATGKRLTAPSQDVAASQQIAELSRKETESAAYAANLTTSASMLKQADSTLDAINNQMVRAREIATQAASGTMSDDARRALGTELNAVVATLVGLGNTRDLNGQPLFGDPSGDAAVVKQPDGSYAYSETGRTEIPVGEGMTMQASETAKRIFTSSAGDTLAILGTLAAALTAGTGGGQAAKDSLDAIGAAADQVTIVQTSVGARAARVELQQTQLAEADADRAELRSGLEDVDITATITELQKTLTTLSATQASFSKLSSLSLFDYLR